MADSNHHNDETLAAQLLAPDVFADLVEDYKSLIESKVKQKGATLRTTFRMAQKMSPDLSGRMMRGLLPDFVRAMEPLYAGYRSQDEQNFRDYLMARQDAVAEAVMSSADTASQRIKKRALRSSYDRVRGSIHSVVMADTPDIVDIIARYA